MKKKEEEKEKEKEKEKAYEDCSQQKTIEYMRTFSVVRHITI